MACPICFSPCYSGVSLSNGEVIHTNCFQKLTGAIVDTDRALSSERARIYNLRRQLESQETLIGKVARFFGRGADLQNLNSHIELAETSLLAAEIACDRARAKATPVFDVMLDYPPDWSLRTAAVAARDRACINCSSSRILQAHHIVPLSKGGTNKLTNLKLLCERCHRRVHGGKEFTSSKSGKALAISDRVQIINSVIAARGEVEFMYRKPTDTSHRMRRVTPHALVVINHERDDGETLCLKGYCHLRNAERTFALKRMRGLKLGNVIVKKAPVMHHHARKNGSTVSSKKKWQYNASSRILRNRITGTEYSPANYRYEDGGYVIQSKADTFARDCDIEIIRQ